MIFEGTKNQFFLGLELTRAGQAYPDISNLIQISKLFNVTNVNTYAAYMNETDSTRLVTPEIQKLITENL